MGKKGEEEVKCASSHLTQESLSTTSLWENYVCVRVCVKLKGNH